jgi:flagellar secretion chaperone FliS
MYGRNSALANYGRVANAESDPLRQVVMLYDGAIKFLRLSASAIETGDLPGKAEHTARALEIVGYLQSVLDFERGGEVAPTLDRLYSSVTAIILKASARLDAAGMRRAADLLAPG